MDTIREWWRLYRLHRRMEQDFEFWQRVNRWYELADYNGRRGRGILHTPEYDARMADEQAAFNAETEAERAARLDPSR